MGVFLAVSKAYFWEKINGRSEKGRILRTAPTLDKHFSRGDNKDQHGLVAQLGAHHIRIVGVEGSNPFKSTNRKATLAGGFLLDVVHMAVI